MKKFKEFWRKGIKQKAIVIGIVLIMFVIGSIIGSNKNTSFNYEFSKSENLSLELTQHNTTTALDEITNKAKKDRENDTKEEKNKVINDGLYFIKNNVNDLAKDNETMEKSLYYGYYIYSCIENEADAKNITELGEKEQAVYKIGYNTFLGLKFRYRNVEQINENKIQTVKENLAKI